MMIYELKYLWCLMYNQYCILCNFKKKQQNTRKKELDSYKLKHYPFMKNEKTLIKKVQNFKPSHLNNHEEL